MATLSPLTMAGRATTTVLLIANLGGVFTAGLRTPGRVLPIVVGTLFAIGAAAMIYRLATNVGNLPRRLYEEAVWLSTAAWGAAIFDTLTSPVGLQVKTRNVLWELAFLLATVFLFVIERRVEHEGDYSW